MCYVHFIVKMVECVRLQLYEVIQAMSWRRAWHVRFDAMHRKSMKSIDDKYLACHCSCHDALCYQ